MAHKKSRPSYEGAPIVTRSEALDLGLKQYFTGKVCKNGHLSPRQVKGSHCVECDAEKALAWQKRAYLAGDTFRHNRREERVQRPEEYLFRGCRSRARRKGQEFTITRADVKIPALCPCCQGQLKLKEASNFKPGPVSTSPSLDRIDSAKGYVPGNVEVICWRCNELKRSSTIDDLKNILRYMEDRLNKPALKLVRSA